MRERGLQLRVTSRRLWHLHGGEPARPLDDIDDIHPREYASMEPQSTNNPITLALEWREFAEAVADRYGVVSELGRGGMAVVLLARDVRHDRDVALKLFRPAVSAALEAERFGREIQVAARLNHPHIVPLFDSGAAAGYLFNVMPFVRGESLRQRLDRDGPFDIAPAVRLMIEVCGALDYAHRDGIVHRDIKPENILLSEGHALVADFGIAYALGQAAGNRLTGTGLALGTPEYMSPEQAGGDSDLDARSDQYSMACVLFELLTGSAPFRGPTAMAFLAQHLTQPAPAVTTLRAEVPEYIEVALHRALNKDPSSRIASTGELARALAEPNAPSATPPVGDSVVVLDFMNVTADPSVQWLSGGIAETLGVDLNRIGSVRVVRREKVARALAARTRSVASEDDALSVARALGARWVVWGAYQVSGDRIRITPRFGSVSAGSIITSSKLDGAMSEVFGLQDRIVDEVLALFKMEVTAQERALLAQPATTSLSAFELFARSRQLQLHFTPTAMLESRALLRQALDRDPNFALAQSGLGFSYAFGFIASSDPTDLVNALTHLERATSLDAGLGEAFAWQAYALGRAGRFDEAVHAGERAVALEPDLAIAHYFLALAFYGVTQSGAAQWRMHARAVHSLFNAVRAEPGYQASYHVLADLYLTNGQYAEATIPIERALAIESGVGRSGIAFIGALFLDGALALRLGDLERAQQQFGRAIETYASSAHLYAQLHLALAHNGLSELARRRGDYASALIEAHQAIQICRAHPRQNGTGFTVVRAHLLAAKANFSLGVHGVARTELAEAERLLSERNEYAFLPLYQANEGIVAYDCASVYALSGKFETAMTWLERAWEACWNDHPALLSNSDFARMQALPAFVAFVERCRSRGSLPDPGPTCEGTFS